MIAYLMTSEDGSTDGVVLVEGTHADAEQAAAARRFYEDKTGESGFSVSAIFEGVTLFKMEGKA